MINIFIIEIISIQMNIKTKKVFHILGRIENGRRTLQNVLYRCYSNHFIRIDYKLLLFRNSHFKKIVNA